MHVRTLRHDRTVFRTSATAENSALLLEEDLRIDCGHVFVSLLFFLLVPSFMRSQTPMIEHPLTAQEYWRVLAWKAGDLITREADVIVMRKGVVTEVRADLDAARLCDPAVRFLPAEPGDDVANEVMMVASARLECTFLPSKNFERFGPWANIWTQVNPHDVVS
jgi:hypothetical protein